MTTLDERCPRCHMEADSKYRYDKECQDNCGSFHDTDQRSTPDASLVEELRRAEKWDQSKTDPTVTELLHRAAAALASTERLKRSTMYHDLTAAEQRANKAEELTKRLYECIGRLERAVETAIDELDPTSCIDRDEVADSLRAIT